ncbi:MAG: hypothetical protein H6Q04_21 [Acidobacteria bacterium]|nr:hypothetical protein [Acidobacteriota bacterium]
MHECTFAPLAEEQSVVATKCPKCGFYQEQGSECGRCGIIFDRYRPVESELRSFQHSEPVADFPKAPSPGRMRRAFRIFRWSSVGVLAFATVLILMPSPPPEVEANAKTAELVETKVRKFATLLEKGQALPLEMNQVELNSWISINLALQRSTAAAEPFPQRNASVGGAGVNMIAASLDSGSTLEEVQSTITDVKIELLEDSLRAYVSFDFHGKELTLVLEGLVKTQDGYLRFEPTSGQLGSLPLPAVALENAARYLFEDPKNRENFRLPSQIQGIHVLRGNLLIIPQ